MGKVVAKLANEEMELARVSMRRSMGLLEVRDAQMALESLTEDDVGLRFICNPNQSYVV